MKIIRFIWALIELARPVNVLITGLAVWIGGILAGGHFVMRDELLLRAALSAALIAAGGNAANDAYDEEIDMMNRPNRPIPSGRIGYVSALVWGGVLTLAGIIVGFWISSLLGGIAIGVSLLLWGYSQWWKQSILLGNFLVAFCGGAAFIYGAIAVGDPKSGMYPSLFAFLIHLGREIIKDVEDAFGDGLWGAMTLPVVAGRGAAQRISALMMMILIVVTFIPYLIKIYSIKYLIAVIILVDIPLLTLIILLFLEMGRDGLKRTSRVLKLIMIGGLFALFIGGPNRTQNYPGFEFSSPPTVTKTDPGTIHSNSSDRN